ncbi:hypothetical protein CEXT_300241 [Caerostris extrusa]|uniref:Uncharacterized protein n=1 Tax=Caerostris extrusa TaxID=172846 RepID=A0AAV4VY45_CAEEX|nr:hypothetical protein CEXT_300241 [Caerostris extrusa]
MIGTEFLSKFRSRHVTNFFSSKSEAQGNFGHHSLHPLPFLPPAPEKEGPFPFCIHWWEIMNNIRKPLHTSQAADFGNEITSRYDCRPGFKTSLYMRATLLAVKKKKRRKDEWQREEEDNKQSSTTFHLLQSE